MNPDQFAALALCLASLLALVVGMCRAAGRERPKPPERGRVR